MDDADLFKMAGVSTTGFAVILIVYRFLKSIRGKKLVSNCCGIKGEISIDIQHVTPKPTQEAMVINIRNPIHETEKV